MNRKRFRSLLLIVLFLFISGTAQGEERRNTLFQVSPIDALMAGDYEGTVTFLDLKRHGDLGIGTFDALDGEMIGIDGRFYQIRSDGNAYAVPDSATTPFAVLVFFSPERTIPLDQAMDLRGLEKYLDQLLPTKNIVYAFRLEGAFRFVKTRSVPGQEKPYRPLVEAVKGQRIFEFDSPQGTIAGFRFPEYMKGVNVPGYHFHFITADRRTGGHLLDCRIDKVKVEIQSVHDFKMALPGGGLFYRLHLGGDKSADVNRVERGTK